MSWWTVWLGVAATGLGWGLGLAQQPVQTHGASLIVQTGQAEVPTSLALSPDGHYAVVAGGLAAVLWDVRSGKELRQFIGHRDKTRGVAYSPDGKYVLTGSFDRTARLWDVRSGRTVQQFVGHLDGVESVAFSPDGKSVLTGSDDTTARLWDVASGRELQRFGRPAGSPIESTQGAVSAVAFSPDGKQVVTGGKAGAQLWDVASGDLVRGFLHSDGAVIRNAYNSVACSPDGRWVASTVVAGMVDLWEMKSGRLVWSQDGEALDMDEQSLAFSQDSKLLFVGGYRAATALNVVDGGMSFQLPGGAAPVALSPQGQFLLTRSKTNAKHTLLWGLATRTVAREMQGQNVGARMVASTRDGRYLFTLNDDAAEIWDTAGGARVMRLLRSEPPRSAIALPEARMQAERDRSATSPDGKSVLSIHGEFDGRANLTRMLNVAKLRDADGQVQTLAGHQLQIDTVGFSSDSRYAYTESKDLVQVWEVSSGRLVYSFPTSYRASSAIPKFLGETDAMGRLVLPTYGNSVLSPDGKWFLYSPSIAAADPWGMVAHLEDTATGREVRQFRGHTAGINAMVFSADSKYALTGSNDSTMRLWDVQTGNALQTYTGNTDVVEEVAFDGDPRYVISGSLDGVTTIWNRTTGEAVVKLFSIHDGGWAVVDPQGRFDTSDLDGGAPLNWVVKDDPMRALPLEIFMRDYYTPGLLARVMKGEKLPEIRSIAEIKDRMQPGVKVVSVTPSAAAPGRVDVVVHAASMKDEKGTVSGLQDLRLFRDGQMVADGYREGPLKDGDFTFKNVMLKTGAQKVTFTAYAFNSERIKSQTATLEYEPKNVVVRGVAGAAAKPHAYLLQIGENHYQAQDCELKYGGNDAVAMSEALRERLDKQGYDVEAVRLISTLKTDKLAASDNGGRDDIRKAIAAIAARATPDDVFFLSFSGHGYSRADGQFFILPSNIQGSCRHADDALLKNAISADDLTDWLRPVDAGEMTFVLDACFSAKSVETNDFKPGPMGSRGLGQLAYDKRMRILAASQSDETAGEYDRLQQGLLSYVLTKDGLEADKADWKPKDGKITLGEWLSYAANAVPQFKPDAVANAETKGVIAEDAPSRQRSLQVPAVFDFSKADAFVLQQAAKP